MQAKRRRLIATLQQEAAKERLRSYSKIRRAGRRAPPFTSPNRRWVKELTERHPSSLGLQTGPLPCGHLARPPLLPISQSRTDLRHRISYRMPSRRLLRGAMLTVRPASSPGREAILHLTFLRCPQAPVNIQESSREG